MKKLIILAFVVMVLLVFGLMVGCGFVLTGSGDLKTEEYAFRDFNRVQVSSAFEFEISRSNSYSISITADDNVIEKVQVTKEGDTLKIGLRTTPRLGSLTLKAVVTMPYLRGLAISGASRGTISDFSSADDVDITVSGASKVTGDITAGEADFEVSGASTVQLEGSANNIAADVSGASRFNLGDFMVDNANVTFSGASTGTVNLSGKLDANLSGASKLSYIGEPIMGNINTSGASTLRKK
ncbi:head GIN domain-containing protein [Chloroflexota bacterium]